MRFSAHDEDVFKRRCALPQRLCHRLEVMLRETGWDDQRFDWANAERVLKFDCSPIDTWLDDYRADSLNRVVADQVFEPVGQLQCNNVPR